jgi:hypothetical protein
VSSISRSRFVKDQPSSHTFIGGAGGARTRDPGIMSTCGPNAVLTCGNAGCRRAKQAEYLAHGLHAVRESVSLVALGRSMASTVSSPMMHDRWAGTATPLGRS